jgi:hypothetical protein
MIASYALIVAAGRGTRFGGALPKQYLPLGGHSVLRHGVDRLSDLVRAKLIFELEQAGDLSEMTPAHQNPATEEWSNAAKSGEVPEGTSRVYVFLGRWHFPEAQFFKETKNNSAADVYVNQVNVGGLNPGECLVIDLPPGAYSFAWLARSRYPYGTTSSKLILGAHEAHFLSIETDQRVSLTPPDAVVGYFVEQPEGLSLVKPMTIVLPDASAMSRLKP